MVWGAAVERGVITAALELAAREHFFIFESMEFQIFEFLASPSMMITSDHTPRASVVSCTLHENPV